MKCCKILWLFCLLWTSTQSLGQGKPGFSTDTARINQLLADSKPYLATEPDKAIALSTQARELAENAGYQLGLAYALKDIGVGYYYKGKYMEALQYYNQSLQVFQYLNDNVNIAKVLSNIGIIYYDQGNDTKALDFYLQSLRHAELSKDKVRILVALNNIGGVYFIKEQTYSEALAYYEKAVPLCEEIGDKEKLGTLAVNIGSIYFNRKDDAKALFYFEKALKAYGNSELSLNAYNAMGKVYLREAKYKLALQNHSRALTIAKKIDNKMSLTQTYMGLGNVYKQMNELRAAIDYYHQAEKEAVEIKANHELNDLYKEMALAYANIADYQAAFKYQSLHTEKSIEIFNADQEKSIQKLQFNHDLQTKQNEINLQDLQIKKQKAFKNALIIGLGLVMIIIIVLYRDYRMKVRTNKLLDKQKLEIENLLLNILPQEVAYELKTTGKSTPRNYESVSVLFTDFKSFTAHAEKMSPHEVVEELNTCFIAFDEIIGRHNLEKIKTIGDAYMCAGGIPTPGEGHVFRIVAASLEIQDFIYRNNLRRKEQNLPPWEIRIGINVGPVVAGVVGKKKYAYDIWGSAVNIASRMESNGMPGQINISSSVYEIIKDKYACIYRGKIYAKNVGDIDMYFIDHEIESFDGFNAFEEAEKKEAVHSVPEKARTKDLLQ